MSSNIFEMCRCCGDFDLTEPEKLIPIFGPGEHQNLIANIKKVLISCWEIKIAENDGFPQHICPTCFAKFDAFFSLRAFCRKAQTQLNTFFKKMTSDRVEKCFVYKEVLSTFINNEEIKTNEGKTKSSICIKKKQVETGKKWLKSRENQNIDSEVKDFDLNSIEFVAIPDKTRKNQRTSEDSNALNERDAIEQSEFEDDKDHLQESVELKNYEIWKQLNNDDENDHEIEISELQSCFSENENTLSIDDENYEKNTFFQAKTDEENKNVTYKNLSVNLFACKYCCADDNAITPNDDEFQSMEALNAHIKLQHDPAHPYTCTICKKTYTTNQACRVHILIKHKNMRNLCWICGMNFTRLKPHMDRCHTVADFQCDTCGKKFKNTSPALFEYHKKWHNKKNQYKCRFCGKIFIQSTHLHTHMLVHTKDYYIKCDKCGKGFKSQYDKGYHMHKVHGDALPVKCLYCEERFALYQKRANHMIKMHGHVQNITDEKIKCLKCDKQFRRESGFRKHMEGDCLLKKTQMQLPKIKKYACEQCSRRFGKQSALLKHIPLHSNEGRPFQCDVCQLHYKTHSHLDIHKRLKHSNEKPFTCDVCGKRFAFRFCMNDHRRFHKVKTTMEIKTLITDGDALNSLDKS